MTRNRQPIDGAEGQIDEGIGAFGAQPPLLDEVSAGAGAASGGLTKLPENQLICDITQSWSASGGGGISTYLKEKRRYFLENTDHRLLQIVPGPEDKITVEGRTIFAEVGAPQVWGSPNYRWINRNDAVFELLREYMPNIIESQCPWVLPWLVIRHRWKYPDTALVAGYRTDFPNAQIYRVMKDLSGHYPATFFKNVGYFYAWMTYNRFDRVYALNREAERMINKVGQRNTGVLGLGVNVDQFCPSHRDPDYRRKVGLPEGKGPLLIYAGRLDNEKRAYTLVDMFKNLPPELDAAMVLLGEGKLRESLIEQSQGLPIAFPGYITNRQQLATALASCDIYVSGMADETFGISVLEAQASGLPVVGVASGAMPERVPEGTGALGPVDDYVAMAQNVVKVWRGDYAGMRERSIALANSHNRWEQTFDQLLNVEYVEALKARDARREGAIAEPLKRALSFAS
ncbi:glycosyltransferase [Erythrobacter sp. THAF29]|uniref:glycosyltransferase n=1 Tax=Erythrobacter sp. THAF29 TaxID=2587851 RepID=UPI0012A86188|nr:glycosyltransferase [Erythrobacter sp. THAF29]QFT77325.1 GDP-mannose-dependent alpha-(1-6)-phosphatidylinositol dimannoside mannosyltransferase [Erythrobacter sp. THAF29]